MAILEVLPYPNPFLRRRATPVEKFDDALRAIVADMEATMADRDGLGLAATQVGLDLRLLVLDPYAFEREEGAGKPNVVVINPEVVWRSVETEVAEEGCLSFPGVYLQVERPLEVRVAARDVNGEPFEISASRLGARALLHEIDHLEGVVMIDRVSYLARTRALKKHQKNQAARAESDAKRRRKPAAANRPPPRGVKVDSGLV